MLRQIQMALKCALISFGGMWAITAIASAEDWPQFRGPNCTGISTSTMTLPTEFSATENVKWSVELGDGIGCPVVAAGRVFVSAMVDQNTVGLYAFDAESGNRLWKRAWDTGPLPEIHATNSHAATTAAADDERVYFYFSTLGMARTVLMQFGDVDGIGLRCRLCRRAWA
jgi:outer membrane protein assembly factor BamB